MEQIYLGCDGGATKTEFILVNGMGKVLGHSILDGIVYAEMHLDVFKVRMQNALMELLVGAKISPGQVRHSVFGMTGYGELKDASTDMLDTVGELLGEDRVTVCNDSVIGWSGSLIGQPGISIVSGTGSIAYGEDGKGGSARAGGWTIRFNDEGSCSWIGAEAIALFFRQADGRMEKSPLYDVFCETYGLKADMELLDILATGAAVKDAELAKMQLLVLEAYKRGDDNARALYERAAAELAGLAEAIIGRLDFDRGAPVSVSYSGGLYKAGACILKPFAHEVETVGGKLIEPQFSPIIGAILYGRRSELDAPQLEELAKKIQKQL